MASNETSEKNGAGKRKKLEGSDQTAMPPRKKYRWDRVINVQSASSAFAHGEIDVSKFVKAREEEIKALENAIKTSKASAAINAFQEVPRSMRRRTGSHNVKRIPKRLRARASRQVGLDF